MYYIHRNITHQSAIKHEILNDKEVQKIIWYNG